MADNAIANETAEQFINELARALSEATGDTWKVDNQQREAIQRNWGHIDKPFPRNLWRKKDGLILDFDQSFKQVNTGHIHVSPVYCIHGVWNTRLSEYIPYQYKDSDESFNVKFTRGVRPFVTGLVKALPAITEVYEAGIESYKEDQLSNSTLATIVETVTAKYPNMNCREQRNNPNHYSISLNKTPYTYLSNTVEVSPNRERPTCPRISVELRISELPESALHLVLDAITALEEMTKPKKSKAE